MGKVTFAFIAGLVLILSSASYANLKIDDPVLLSRLEKSGFDLGTLTLGATTHLQTNAQLLTLETYRSIVESLTKDLEQLKKSDPKLSTTMATSHRLFNKNWLVSQNAFFELVGIVNRLDRQPFKKDSCGEFRFIYRLAYLKNGKSVIYSRLPMTINAVFFASSVDRTCQESAQLWENFLKKVEKPDSITSPADLKFSELKSIEINMQSVRWPSTVRPDMGGYAEYILRVFKRNGSRFALSVLENTPDVSLLKKNPYLRTKLLKWLQTPTALKEIDEGIVQLPDEFLDKRTTSFALHGVHRLANAQFNQIFAESDFKQVDFSKFQFVKSPHGFLRRLNDMSCPGCHQGRSVAGFHFLGQDNDKTNPVNAILVSSSPHFLIDQDRRQSFQNQLLAKQIPDSSRPFSVRAEQTGAHGSHCGLGDPTFENWKCGDGLECKSIIEDSLLTRTGTCVPKSPVAGSACQPGSMKMNIDPLKDKVVLSKELACRDTGFCEATSVGFPGGMCAGTCDNLKESEVCGSIAVLAGFNECLGKGTISFDECLKNNVRPRAMQRCNETNLCRDDYICTKTSSGEGACIPPYFLFQLRVDGHGKI